ncbi:MAG: hypothetical protein K0S08_1727 [Gammaproteobacteria bacterium]|nr:hypothetical protein [Gammaproteobacteria bacterium]
MLWFKKQAKGLVGIDIDNRYIKYIELDNIENQPEVLQYAITELPMVVLTETNEIKDASTISSALTGLQLTHPTTSNQAAIALPGASVVTKLITLPKDLSDVELENQVWLEAGKNFPDLIEDLSLDFYVNGPANGEEGQLEILLVACRTTSLVKRLEVLKNSNFTAKVVEVDYYCLERALNYILTQQAELDKTKPYALLNFSCRSSTLVAVQNDKLLYAHDHSFESQRLLQKLQQDLQWQNIVLHPPKADASLDPITVSYLDETLISHVRYALDMFYSSKQSGEIQQLFLAGECAIIPGIADLIASHLEMKVAIANPILNMPISKAIDANALQAHAPLLTLCCGLALHEGSL